MTVYRSQRPKYLASTVLENLETRICLSVAPAAVGLLGSTETFGSVVSATSPGSVGAALLAPAAPTRLAIALQSSGAVKLSWRDNASNESGYRVYRSTTGANFTLVASLAANVQSYLDAAVIPGTTYWYTASAWNSAGETTSAVISAKTATVPLPAVPDRLVATALSASSITFTWHDKAANEAGYRVYRSTDGTAFTLVASLATNAQTYTDKNLSGGTRYWYKADPWNSAGEAASAAAAATTLAAPTPPSAPSNLAAASSSASSVSLTWTDNASNESGFHIYRSSDATTFIQIATLAANTVAYSDGGLSASTAYWYLVDPWNSVGETATNSATATTQALPLPTDLPVTVTTRNRTSFAELVINGTSGNDLIVLSQSGSTFTIAANGRTQTLTGTFGDVVINGQGGSNSITIDSSVNIATLLYGGAGNNTLTARGPAFSTLITIGGGNSTLTGNGVNTNYWADAGDTVNASSAEIAAGGVHRVASIVSPPLPTDTTAAYTLAASSLWGTGPTFYDVRQGGIADCYYLAAIQSLAFSNPAKLRSLAADLGDGTYLVDFTRGGVHTFVRVDGVFSGQASAVGASGNNWAVVMEKAYAYFRSGANTYASLNSGNSGTVMGDFGMGHAYFFGTTAATTIYSTFASKLAAGKAVTVATNTSTSILVANHGYSVIGVSTDSSGLMWVTLRNPWGFDGRGNDSNPADGIVTITMAAFQSNVSWADYAT